MNKEEDKVIIPVHKELLESERKELKAKRKKTLGIIIICVFLFLSGLAIGFVAYAAFNPRKEVKQTDTLGQIEYYMEKLWLYANDYDDLIDTLEDNSFYGMTTYANDPYTTYMSNDELNSFSTSINMNYVGIGVQYSSIDGVNTIDKVFKNSPAEEAGLLAGDIILYIDGHDISTLDTTEIKNLVIGEAGSIVNVVIKRFNEVLKIDVVRGAVDSSVYASTNDDYVLLEINSFGVDSADNIMNYLNDYEDYSKIIIDLRDNSGGYQSAVAEIAGLFIGNNEVYMLQEDKDGNLKTDYTKCSKTYDNFKQYVVLVNNNTASAAEVLAICLKEQLPDVKLVGVTTYGKGVVQTTLSLKNGAALKLTTSKWLSPNGVWINGEGITPDIEVKLDDVLYEKYLSISEGTTYELDQVASQIKTAQKCLKFLDYEVKRTDGYFDESLAKALRQFKIEHNLSNDSILDSETYNSLLSSVTYEWANNPLKDYQMQKAIELLK